MSDLNGYSVEGGYSDYFHQPGEYGGTSSFTQASTTNSDPLGGSKGDGYFVEPKRSKWFNNILKARANNRNNNI
jgi:hypothetical protein